MPIQSKETKQDNITYEVCEVRYIKEKTVYIWRVILVILLAISFAFNIQSYLKYESILDELLVCVTAGSEQEVLLDRENKSTFNKEAQKDLEQKAKDLHIDKELLETELKKVNLK